MADPREAAPSWVDELGMIENYAQPLDTAAALSGPAPDNQSNPDTVEVRSGGKPWVLVRWEGGGGDTWQPRANLDRRLQRLADRMLRAVGGVKARASFVRPGGVRQQPARKVALLARLRRLDGLAIEARARVEEMEEGAESHEERRAVKRGWVIADPLEEMELRGEEWRTREAERGRDVRRRT